MNQRLRTVATYITGILIGSAVFGGVSFASTGLKFIEAHYANIALSVNQKTISTQAEPFIYNSNVYVPVSAVAHGLSAKVSWDGKTHIVDIEPTNQVSVLSGQFNYYGLPVYSGTNTVMWQGKTYVSAYALATAANLPTYFDATDNTLYIGAGPVGGMPLSAFYDTRDYGDYAVLDHGAIGPQYGWANGAPVVANVTYPNSNSLVWASHAGSLVPGVQYNLRGQYTSITGAFGLDDSTSGKDAVQLTIMGDGKQLYQSPWMTHGQAADPITANVTGIGLVTFSLAVKSPTGTVVRSGQALPSATNLDVDVANVLVH